MVSPIERQQSILQAGLIDRINQIQQQHPDMQQRYFKIQLEQERQELKKKINQSGGVDRTTIGKEEEKKRDAHQENLSGKDHPDTPDTEAESSNDQDQGILIDIKV